MVSDPETAAIRAAVTAPVLGDARAVRGAGTLAARLDGFGRVAGPDVAIVAGPSMVRMYAVFDVDPASHDLSVRVMDESGRMVRMIPPDSIRQMLAAMARYRR